MDSDLSHSQNLSLVYIYIIKFTLIYVRVYY